MNPDIFFSKTFLINLLIIFIPFSFIAGNLILNLNILLLIFFGLFFHGFEIFRNNLSKIDKIIIILFIYIVANGVFNNFFNFNFSEYENKNIILIKSLLFSRFLIMYFVLKFLIRKNLINYKLLFFSFGFSVLFVSIDIIIQYFYGKDIFGFDSSGRRLSGPFNDEYIAGSFIQKFFIFLPLSILLFFKNKNNLHFYLLILLILTISFLGLIFAGNRMPLILFILVLGIFLLYQKKIQKILLISLIILSASLSYLMYTNKEFTYHYRGFYVKAFQISDYLKAKLNSDSKIGLYNTHIKEIETGILTWKQNKFFGSGLKSFRLKCKLDYKFQVCNTHPHNYLIEILLDVGLIGFIFIYLAFGIAVKRFVLFYLSNPTLNSRLIVAPFFLIFFFEIFPLRSTGSFFTTSNAVIIFFVLAIINNYYKNLSYNEIR